MRLTTFASAWTFGSLAECMRAVEHGPFDGIEGPPPVDVDARRALARELAQRRVPFLAEACTGGDYAPSSHVPESVHFEALAQQLEHAVELSPVFVNCLAGSDSWPLAQAVDFYGRALSLAEKLGLELSFEIHRGRPTFHPSATRELLRALPALRLTCDFSHWCVVCERLVDDESILALCFERARHIHGRVGYAQGPQVPDPVAVGDAQRRHACGAIRRAAGL